MQQHWEHVYGTKGADEVSWFRPHLETSLALVERAAKGNRGAAILDVGGGAATLVDDLLARGYANLSVLDIAQSGLEQARKRLGDRATRVHWLRADVLQHEFLPRSVEVWHDRAVFHFLTEEEDRQRYVRAVAQAMVPGGHVIVSTFGPEGPVRCSGLDVKRYDADSLHAEFGVHFRLVDSLTELHKTPFETTQQFLYCYCVVER